MKNLLIALILVTSFTVSAQEKSTFKIEKVLLKIKGKTIVNEKLEMYAILSSDRFTILFSKENDTYLLTGFDRVEKEDLPKNYDSGFVSKAINDESNICTFYMAKNKTTGMVLILIINDNDDSILMLNGKFL
jgi:choline kinase